MPNKISDLYNINLINELNTIVNVLHNEQFSNTDIIKILTNNISKNNVGVFNKESRTIENVIKQSIEEVFQYRVKMNHKNFYGFVPSPVSTLSWLGEIISTGFNVHAGSWLQSSGYSNLEMNLISWLNSQFGYGNSAGGIFLSGGSIANMTGLLLARDSKLLEKERQIGVAYLSTQTHSSVEKALKMIGFLPHQIRKINVNRNFQIDVEELKKQIEYDISQNQKPFLIIANAGTTNTGSIDDLKSISQISKTHNLWLHIDGAYGGSVILSKKYKHLLSGIENADSISCDPHKWMFQTYGCSVLLVKQKNYLTQSFHTNPEYLNDAKIKDNEVNFWDFGPELTRPARAFKLWFTLQVAGTELISDAISQGFKTAEYVEKTLRKDSKWEIISNAHMAIINFRFFNKKYSETQLNEINQNIAKKAIEDGKIGILSTKLNNKTVLRMCCIHPLTTEEDIEEVISLLSKYLFEILL